MAKYKAGDPVWARPATPGDSVIYITKETAAVVTGVYENCWLSCRGCSSHTAYLLDILPPDVYGCGCRLRPRRDDYQQREGLAHTSLHDIIILCNVVLREDIKMTEPA